MPLTVSATNIAKRYGGVVALADGALTVQAGEVVALVGANGSGKSTLSKIVTGVVSPDGGKLTVDGKTISFRSPHAARKLGITAVYQELSLVPGMTIGENIWLAHEPLRGRTFVNRRNIRTRTQALLDLFAGVITKTMEPDTPVFSLPPDEKQIVEILKALSQEPELIILDEATASLDSRQVSRLFELVQEWKAQGRGIVFVSHRMDEIFRIADRIVVLRNGRTVGELMASDASEREIVALMIGVEATGAGSTIPDVISLAGAAQADGAVRLHVENLQSGAVRGVSFDLHDGELLGLGGLRGQGQEDMLLALFGAQRCEGELRLGGEAVTFQHPHEAMDRGMAYVPGERNAQGLLSIRSILENLQLPSWGCYGLPLKMKRARRDAQRVADDLRMVMAGLDAPVNSLSGGNAQKVVLGKWLLRAPRLLLLNDPTKGVDVGAKAEIYRLMAELRAQGTAILFYSSDDEELISLCDRVLVLHDGLIRADLSGDTLTRTNLVAASIGASHGSHP
ncbi:MAG: sugar ABC transporter ATP-binding protein [Caldilinea sp.]